MIYDAYGRPVTNLNKGEMTRRAAAVTVRDKWRMYPSDGLTPVRLARILKEADGGDVTRQMELFSEMEGKDAHLAAVLQTRKNAVRGLPYEVTPATDDSRARRIADDVTEMLSGLDLPEVFLDLLDAIGKGFALSEIVWTRDGGRLSVSELAWVPQTKVTFIEADPDPYAPVEPLPRLLTREAPTHGIPLPPFKFIYHRYKARSGYDTGAGVLRVVAWMYLFKNYAIKDWVAFAEVYGMPLRLGKYEPGASPEDKDALAAAVQSLGSDAAGIISKSTEIEFVEAVRNASSDLYQTLVTFANTEMSKAILGQTLTTEEGQRSGSYALGKVHEQVRHDLLEGDARALATALTRQLIRPYVGLNYGWDAPVPTFSFKVQAPEDLKETAEVYKALKEMGYPLTLEHVSQTFHVPLPKKGEAVLPAPAAPAGQAPLSSFSFPQEGAPVVGASSPPNLRQAPRFTPDQEAIEGLIMTAAGEAANDKTQATLRALIDQATSYEDLQERIAEKWPELSMAQFEEMLGRALFMAEMFGRHQVFRQGDGEG